MRTSVTLYTRTHTRTRTLDRRPRHVIKGPEKFATGFEAFPAVTRQCVLKLVKKRAWIRREEEAACSTFCVGLVRLTGWRSSPRTRRFWRERSSLWPLVHGAVVLRAAISIQRVRLHAWRTCGAGRGAIKK